MTLVTAVTYHLLIAHCPGTASEGGNIRYLQQPFYRGEEKRIQKVIEVTKVKQ